MSASVCLRRFVASGCCLVVAAIASPVAADPEAARAIEHGLELRRAQRDEEALAEFRRAYAVEATPRARAQIALAEQALGRWRDAEVDLEAALVSQDDNWIAANRNALEITRTELAGHLATLRVTSNIPGAKLRLNAEPAVPLPQSFRVEAGDVSLRVEAPGFEPVARSQRLTGGELLDEDFDLVPLSPGPTPTCPPAPIGRPAGEKAPPPSRPSSRAAWGWATLGAASLPLAFGVVETIVRDQHASLYDDNTRCPPGYKEALCGGERASAETATILSVVGYAGAASLASIGAVLILTSSRDSVRLTTWAAPGGGMAAIDGGF
jgi:hypothetical protein